MSDRMPLGYRLKDIANATPETAEEMYFIAECKAALSLMERNDNNINLELLWKKITELETSEMGTTIYYRKLTKGASIRKEREQRAHNKKRCENCSHYNKQQKDKNGWARCDKHKYYVEYDECCDYFFESWASFNARNPSNTQEQHNTNNMTTSVRFPHRPPSNNLTEKCMNCAHYNNNRRNESGQARCSKHPFWTTDNGRCESFESKFKPKVEPKKETKEEHNLKSTTTKPQANIFLYVKIILMSLSIIIPLVMLYAPSWVISVATFLVLSPLIFSSMTYTFILYNIYYLVKPILYVCAFVTTIQGQQDFVAIAFYILFALQAISMVKGFLGAIGIIISALEK